MLIDGTVVASNLVGLGNGGHVHDIDIAAAIGVAAHGVVAVVGGIAQRVGPAEVGCRECDNAAFSIKFERSMQGLTGGLEFVAPDDQSSVRRDACEGCGLFLRNLVFLHLLQVVGEEHSLDILLIVGSVVEFHPVVLLAIFVDVDGVGSADLVDADRMHIGVLALSGCHLAVSSHEVHSTVGQTDLGISGDVIAFVFTELAEERCVEVDVAGRC